MIYVWGTPQFLEKEFNSIKFNDFKEIPKVKILNSDFFKNEIYEITKESLNHYFDEKLEEQTIKLN